LCTHVAIIKKGRLVAQGSIEELRAGASAGGGRGSTPRGGLVPGGGPGGEHGQIEGLAWGALPPAPPPPHQLGRGCCLRGRTLRNSLGNKNKRLDIIGMAVSATFSLLLVMGVAVGLFAGTIMLFERHQEKYFELVFLGLLVWWQLFPILLAGFAPQFV